MTEEEIAARRAEIAAKVAAARKAQQEETAASSGEGKKKVLSRKERTAQLEEQMMAGGSGGGSGDGKRKALMSRKEKVKAALEEHKMPSAETLKRQAREMSRNPEMVRRANPEMRKLTDAQIREHAKEMEKMAANPEMIHAMMKVQNMPAEERSALVQLQEGLTGKVTRDDKWIADTIRLVKAQPDTLKTLFKGRVPADSPLGEAQIMGIIDYVVTCSDWFLTQGVHVINWAINMRGPAANVYRMVDTATFGCAQYVVMGVVLLVLFYFARFVWYVLSVVLGLGMSGYVWLTSPGQTLQQAGARASAAVEPTPEVEVEHPFQEL